MSRLGLILVVLFIIGNIAWAVFRWRWSNRPHPYLLNRRDR